MAAVFNVIAWSPAPARAAAIDGSCIACRPSVSGSASSKSPSLPSTSHGVSSSARAFQLSNSQFRGQALCWQEKLQREKNSCFRLQNRRVGRRENTFLAPWAAFSGGTGKFWNSEIVKAENERLMNSYQEIMKLQPKYFDFDFQGRQIYLQKMEELLESLEIFTTRFKLSDDPEAKEALRQWNALFLECGVTTDGACQSLRTNLKVMRVALEEEERTGRAPTTAEVKGEVRLNALLEVQRRMFDPDFADALKDPDVRTLIAECLADPDVMRRHMDDSRIAPVVMKILIKMQAEFATGQPRYPGDQY